MAKAIVFDYADPSVGILEAQYEVDVPFEFSDIEDENREFFRLKLAELYGEFADGKIVVHFQDELDKREEEYYKALATVEAALAPVYLQPAPPTGA